MAYATARQIELSEIPVLDIGALEKRMGPDQSLRGDG